MTIQFIKELEKLFLQKKILLEEIIKLIDNQITAIEDTINHINSLYLINENILRLKCECYIVEVSDYFLDFQKVIKIEYEILKLLIEIIQDIAFIKKLMPNHLRGFFNKAVKINLYINSILYYICGKDLEAANRRIRKAISLKDYELALYLAKNEFLTPSERALALKSLLGYAGFKIEIKEPATRKFLVGKPIPNLEVQVIRNNNIFDDLIDDIINEQNYRFVWYISQTHKQAIPIHASRIAQNSDRIIPLDFSRGRSYLTVVMFNEEMQEIARDVTDIELELKREIRGLLDIPIEERFMNMMAKYGQANLRGNGLQSEEQLAVDLTDESENLTELGKFAEQIGAPPQLVEQINHQIVSVDEALDSIEEVAPEVENIPQVKRFKKSRLRRIKARFRLARIIFKRNKKEAFNKGMIVLKQARNLRRKFWEFIMTILSKWKKELQLLEGRIINLLKDKKYFLDLKPIRIGGQRVWVLSRDGTYSYLENQLAGIKQSEQHIGKIFSLLASQSYEKGTDFQKNLRQYIATMFQRISASKNVLGEAFTKIDLKKRTRQASISIALLPLLLGGSPQKIDDAFLGLNAADEATKPFSIQYESPQIKYQAPEFFIPTPPVQEAQNAGEQTPEISKELSQDNVQVLEHAQNESAAIQSAADFVDGLLGVVNGVKSGDIRYDDLPDYVKEMISDGVLDIAVFIGSELEEIKTFVKDETRDINFGQKKVSLRIRYVENIPDALKAFEESDVIYVNSHSRYGIGWALSQEGMANPLRMQTHPIKIPKNELHGYKGRILKNLGSEVIVQTSDEDIKRIKPKKGYQLISMDSCSSGKHFLELMKRLRKGLPTTVIYTTKEISGNRIYPLVDGLLGGKSIEKIVEEMNSYKESERGRYEAVVLNAKAGSLESTQYDKHNIPNSLTLYRDSDTSVQAAKKSKSHQQKVKKPAQYSKSNQGKQKKPSRTG